MKIFIYFLERMMIMKIKENSIYLTANEAREQIYEGEVVETIIGEKLRWGTYKKTIVKIEDKFYCIEWVESATEFQEDEINEDEYPEVIQKETVIKVWVDKTYD